MTLSQMWLYQLWLVAHHLVSMSISYTAISFAEYGTHRWALHRNTIVRLFPKGEAAGPESLKAVFHQWFSGEGTLAELLKQWGRNFGISWRDPVAQHLDDHAVSHHTHYYHCFREEMDPEGKHVGMTIPWAFYKYLLPVAVPLWFIDPLTMYYYLGFVFGHFVVWNLFHIGMHKPTPPWYVRIPPVSWWFKLVEYYHFLHHQHRDANFNAFLPLFDWLLRTSARETDLDRRVWQLMAQGYKVDRRGRLLTVIPEAQKRTRRKKRRI